MLVSMSVDIQAPPEKVWPYLVEPEKTMQWFTARGAQNTGAEILANLKRLAEE